MTAMIHLVLVLNVVLSPDSPVTEGEARKLFSKYEEYGRNSDPREADLLCDEGTILMYREDAEGNVRELRGSAALMKKIMRESASEAKEAGDYSEYSSVSYQQVGNRVQIDSTRYSVLRKYSSPESLIVGRCANGEVGIVETTVHTKVAPENKES